MSYAGMGRLGFGLAAWLIGATGLAAADVQPSEPSERYLAELRRWLPASPAWEAWLERTGERPPDFAQLRGEAGLPDPLRFEAGGRVNTRRDWERRRQELLGLFERYVTGTLPPPPGNVRVAEQRVREEVGAVVEEVTLEFGPGHAARLHVEVIRPPGAGPFPVFVTQDNHRRWALVAVSRGYLGCVYAGADSRDDTGAWVGIWPEHDWTRLARRAWAASRCVDYLSSRADVDRTRIAVTGHSRNGKTALMAAAFDERFAAVISSSSGAGGACTYRFFSEAQFGEGIELITRNFPDWLHPRLRFFVGREDRLPIDQHQLIACIAPRACLISTALNDDVESVWAIEQTWAAAQPVYALLGAERALSLRYREGEHATRAEDIEAFVDWLEGEWGGAPGTSKPASHDRVGQPKAGVGSERIYPTYADWQQASGERIRAEDWPARGLDDLLIAGAGDPGVDASEWLGRRTEIRDRILWGLGETPPLASDPGGKYGAEPLATSTLLHRNAVPPGMAKESLSFGNYLTGDLYYPTNVIGTDRRLPVFIWLHPVSVSHGYVAGYYRGEQPYRTLARSGYAVFAFDQIGMGSRIREIQGFYRRYPRWSLLGKTVRDVAAAMETLLGHRRVDPAQIYLVGYGTGGMVALHAAALDDRVAGVVAVGGFTPMRLDVAEKGTGGVARWSHWIPWVPRLGAFVGQEARVPYDYHEVLALIAPRPALVIVPGVDSQSTLADVRTCVAEARKVYALLGAENSLVLQRTDDYHHFSPELIWCLCGVETIR